MLSASYSSWRRIRGDGNCLYSAFIFGFLERLTLNFDDFSILLEQIVDHHSNFIRTSILGPADFDLNITDEFLECFIELLQSIFSSANNNHKDTAIAILTSTLNDDIMGSKSIIAYLRLVASGWIKLNSDSVLPRIIGLNYSFRSDYR